MSHFVSTQWLADRLDDPKIIVVDASWHMPNAGRDAQGEYAQGHIPGAVFFDIDAIADTASSLPHMLPAPETFAAMVGALGIDAASTIVVYDESGLFSAPRAWWTFKVMGADDVRILEGAGPKWRAEGRPLEPGASSRPPSVFTASPRLDRVARLEDVAEGPARTIVDARPAERFNAEVPEPRPGLRSGHIPGSVNVPASGLVADGRLKPEAQLRAIFAEAGVDPASAITTTCGSGVTAATLALALDVIGARDVMLYDGSWSEWGGRGDTPVAP